jgi:hypothetical protein
MFCYWLNKLPYKNIYWHTPHAFSIFSLKVYIWQEWHYRCTAWVPKAITFFSTWTHLFQFEQGTMNTAKIPYVYSGHILMNIKHQDTNILCWDIRNQYNHDYSDGSSMQKFNNSKFIKVPEQCLAFPDIVRKELLRSCLHPPFWSPV